MARPLLRLVTTLVLVAAAAVEAPAAAAENSVSAQSPYRKELAVLGRIAPGDMLRLEGSELGRIEGRFLGSMFDTLVVSRSSLATRVPLASVDGAWVRRPALRSRAVTGARTGAKVGAVFGGLWYFLLMDRRFNDPPEEYSVGWHLSFIAVDALLFGAFGTLVGAAVGVDHTIWEPLLVAPGRLPAFASGGEVRRSIRMGEASLHAGGAWAATDCTSGRSPYFRANMYATPWSRFAFGPEIGWAPRGLHQPVVAHSGDAGVIHAGLSGRCAPWPSARICPAFTVASGFYSWSERYLGGSVGAGLQWNHRTSTHPVELNVVWHEPLQVPVTACDYRFLTASLGVRFAAW